VYFVRFVCLCDVVLVYSNHQWPNPTRQAETGDLLAEYIENCGKIVVALTNLNLLQFEATGAFERKYKCHVIVLWYIQ
jgi:hypothetical protein